VVFNDSLTLIVRLSSECRARDRAHVIIREFPDEQERIVIPGFGQFVAKHRPSREMRNPSTGQKMMSKAKTSASFKPAAALKDL